jgi:peptide-methionine (S)-S-oxide reductase
VKEVVVGYSGGKTPYPTYRNMKDHTEAVKVSFDPKQVTYSQLLSKFFRDHSPGSSNSTSRPQYNNAVWFKNKYQENLIGEKVEEWERKHIGQKVKTVIAPVTKFYRAEEYHQKYFKKMGMSRGGC